MSDTFDLGAIDVAVEPDTSGFPAELDRDLTRIEKGAKPLEVRVELDRRSRRDLQRDLKAVLASIEQRIELDVGIGRGVRRDLQRDIAAATRGIDVEVPVEAVVGRGFRRDLERTLAAAVGGVEVEVPVQAKIGRGFAAGLRRSIAAELAGTTIEVPVQAIPGPRFRPNLQREILARLGTANRLEVPVDITLSERSVPGFTAEVVRASRVATETAEATGAATIDLEVDGAKAAAQTAAIGRSFDGLGTRLRSALTTAFLVGLAGLVSLTAVAFGGAVVAASNFEQELSNLQAVASPTADQLGLLRDQAIEAGEATVFSASESARAQSELAKAGASVEQILSGGLTAALDLAAAGEIELGDAATFVATGLNTFGLEAGEASRVADALAAAANRSATDIPQMGFALQQSGLVARQFGLTIEETSGTLALFAQNGLTGSDAGTSFRTMLQRLVPQSEEAASTMADLGLEFFDAEGSFIGIEAAAGELQTALSGLTEEQRSAAIQTIFGADAARAANIIFGAGADGIADWTAQVTDAGNASETAAIKLDNLKGDVEELRGSLETVFIVGGESQTAGLRSVVQSLTEVVNLAGPGLVAALTPVGSLISDLAPTFADLTGALSPLLEGFAEFGGPILGGLIRLLAVFLASLGSLFSALRPLGRAVESWLGSLEGLLPVVADVAAEIGLALVPAFEALAEPEVAAALGEIAVAFGEILVAVAPLLPDLVEIGVVLASELLPVISALVPLLGVAADVLVPLLTQLARLSPLILVTVALFRITQGIIGAGKAIRGLLTEIGGVRAQLESVFGNRGGAAIFTGLTTAAAAAGGLVSGYMAGAADDAVTSLLSISGAATSIFLGFQQGGPVGGAIAVAATALGAFFGQAQKRSREAEAAQREYNSAVGELREAFDTAGVDRYSTAGARALVVTQELLEALKDTGDEGTLARQAFEGIGVDFETVAAAAADGADGIQAINDELDRATGRRAEIISQRSLDGVTEFGSQTELVNAALQDTYASIIQIAAVEDVTPPSFSQIDPQNLRELVDGLADYGFELDSLADAQAAFEDNLQARLLDSPAAQYIAALPEQTRDAWIEQERLAEVQRLVAKEQEAQRGSAERFSSAYDDVADSLDTATGAYEDWLDAQTGAEVTLAEVRLGVVDYARELRDLAASTELSPWEKQQQELLLVADAQRDVASAVGQFITESGGDYDLFLQRIQGLRTELETGLVESLGITTEEASLLVAEILQIPSEAQFRVLADTTQAVTGLDDLEARVLTYIGANIDNQVLLDATDPANKLAVVDTLLDQYVARDPEASAFLDTLNAEQRASFLEGILNDLDGQTVTIDADLVISPGEQAEIDRLAGLAGIGGRALGGLITKPEVALIGEDGPELILPLSKPGRMRELLADPAVAAALGQAPALGGDVSLEPAALVFEPQTEPLQTFADETVSIMAELGTRLSTEALPTMITWEEQVSALLGRVGLRTQQTADGMVRSMRLGGDQLVALAVRSGDRQVAAVATTGDRMVATLAAGLDRMKVRAASGGEGIVGALSAALSSGTIEVETIVVGYRGTLVGALNPLLSAVGSTPLALAEGGKVPGPRVERDIIPALLMPGEVVIRRDSVDRFGLSNLLDLNAGRVPTGWNLPRYAEGGVATASPTSYIAPGAIESGSPYAATWPPQVPETPPTVFGDVARVVMEHVRAEMADWLGTQNVYGGAGATLAALWIQQAMALTGVPQSWFLGLMTIARRESGFNPNAINLWDSNAAAGVPSIGLMQTIGPTFAAYALPGLNDIYNPVHNAVAAIRYILARYGDISNVQQANPLLPPRGYENGGLSTYEQLAMISEKNKPELILPLTNERRTVELAEQHGVAAMLERAGRAGANIEEGAVQINVNLPAGPSDPSLLAGSIGRRVVPAISKVLGGKP